MGTFGDEVMELTTTIWENIFFSPFLSFNLWTCSFDVMSCFENSGFETSHAHT